MQITYRFFHEVGFALVYGPFQSGRVIGAGSSPSPQLWPDHASSLDASFLTDG